MQFPKARILSSCYHFGRWWSDFNLCSAGNPVASCLAWARRLYTQLPPWAHESRAAFPTEMGSHFSLLCQAHHSAGLRACFSAQPSPVPFCPQGHVIDRSAHSAFPPARAVNSGSSENLFQQLSWVYTVRMWVLWLDGKSITWNGFGWRVALARPLYLS